MNIDLYELETAVDASADGGAPAATEPASAGDNGDPAATAAPNAGAAAGTDDGTPSGEPAAGSPFNFTEWASTPEGREQLGSTFQSWAAEQQAAQAAEAAAAAAAAENPFSDIEEGLGLLGIDPARFREYMGAQNAPLAEAAQEIQAQKSIAWVDGQLSELGAAKPDLLGEGVGKLAELTGEDGSPLFNPDDVLQANKTAVLQAASAIETVAAQAGRQVSSADALKQAVDTVAARDEQIAKIAVERYKRELAGVGTAATDLSGGGASGAVATSGLEGGDEMAVARRFAREHGLTR